MSTSRLASAATLLLVAVGCQRHPTSAPTQTTAPAASTNLAGPPTSASPKLVERASAQITGTVGKQPLLEPDGFVTLQGGADGKVVVLVLTTEPNACARYQHARRIPGERSLRMVLGTFTDRAVSPPAGPGRFPVEAAEGPLARASYRFSGSDCRDLLAGQAASGAVELTKLDAGGAEGKLSLTFQRGKVTDALSGTFSLPLCLGLPDALVDDQAPWTCERQ